MAEPLTIDDALWNAILFTDRKSHVGDQIRVGDHWVTGSDDHVIIETKFDPPIAGDSLYPTIKEAKALMAAAAPSLEEHTPSPMWDSVDTLLTLLTLEQNAFAVQRTSPKFALRPERFAKFSRIRSGGDYPVDFAFGFAPVVGRDLLLFKVGPYVRGVMAPVLRGALQQEFATEPGVLWGDL